MTPESLIVETILEWEEHLEMYPGNEWMILSYLLAAKLLKEKENSDFYKGLADAFARTKHN